MAELAKALKALIDNPDDLTSLPQLIAKVEELEQSEMNLLTKVGELRDLNKSYLAQIPIGTPDPEPEPEDESEPTLEDAKEVLEELLKGDK